MISTDKTATGRVTRAIQKMLALGELGHPIPPERQLAHLLGVSRVTIRRATGRLEAMGEIRREQGSGTYRCRGPAILSPREVIALGRPVIVLLTDQPGSWFNPQLTPWTWRVCLEMQSCLTDPVVEVCLVNDDRFLAYSSTVEQYPEHFIGFIAPTHLWSPEKYESARELGLPFVGLGRTRQTMFWNIVDLDYAEALEEALEDIQPGPDDRVFIPGESHPQEIDRQQWLQSAMRLLNEYGVPSDQIIVRPGGMFESQGYLATRWYLKEFGTPTVVLADFDLSIAGAYRALAGHGGDSAALKVRIRLLGSGGMEIGRHLVPSLSTLISDYAEVADAALEMLVEQRATGRPQPLRSVKAQYVRRESTQRARRGRSAGVRRRS